MKNNIQVNPQVLKWARKTAHLSIDDVPKSLISPAKLERIEKGDELPTFNQLQKLARKYDRPLYLLLETEIPEDNYQTIPFFRKENKTDYNSPLALFLRDIQKKQDWARNYLIGEGYPELDFIGSISIKNKKKEVAVKIKERLNFPSSENFSYSQRIDFFKTLKESLEANNIFVSITGSDKSNRAIDLEQAQGFAISDCFAPFVFVNTKNTTNAKIFTLVHEVVHLFLNETGISEDVIRFRKSQCHEDEIENFCNEVAAEILMPEKQFLDFFKSLKGSLEIKIEELSKIFLVSQLSACVRLWRLKEIDSENFNSTFISLKEKVDIYLTEDKKRKEDKSGGNYYASMRSKNGVLLSSLVFYAYKEGKILATDISNILKIKTNNFDNYFSLL